MSKLVIDYRSLGLYNNAVEILIELISLDLCLIEFNDCLYKDVILGLLLEGLNKSEIASKTGMDRKTVDKNIKKIRRFVRSKTNGEGYSTIIPPANTRRIRRKA